jgi:hypothetical protein
VRPSDLEVSLHHVPFRSSALDHIIASYKGALTAVLLEQIASSPATGSVQVRSLQSPCSRSCPACPACLYLAKPSALDVSCAACIANMRSDLQICAVVQDLHDLLSVMKDIQIMAPVDSKRRRRIAKVSGRTLAMLGMVEAFCPALCHRNLCHSASLGPT